MQQQRKQSFYMKKGLRFALVGTVLTAAFSHSLVSGTKYTPRTQKNQAAMGAAQYLHSLRANQITGEVSQKIFECHESLENMPESVLVWLGWKRDQ